MKNTCGNKFFTLLFSWTACYSVLLPFAYCETVEIPPVIISVTPSKGLAENETLVTIYGDGIKQGASVRIGNKPVVPMAYFPPKSLTVYSPTGSPGRVDVTLINPDGQSFVFKGGFQYLQNMSGFTERDRSIVEIRKKLNPPMTPKEKLKNFIETHRTAIMKAGMFGGIFCLLLVVFSFSRRNKIIKRIRRERRGP